MSPVSPASRRAGLRALAAAGLAWALPRPAAATPLAKVRERGTLLVAVYNEMPPFHDDGRGVDVDLARALADALGVKLSLLPFPAGEAMSDDLRNMVWKGHYLGYGPADVLMHVPVDGPLIEANPQVRIFAPYYRERLAMARRVDRLPRLDILAQIGSERVAVPGESLAGWLLLGAQNGAYREQIVTHWKDGAEAAQALLRGEYAAAAGLESELQSVLAGDSRFVIGRLPTLQTPREGWAVGLAVKSDADDLALALQKAVNDLAASGALTTIFARAHLAWAPA